MTDDGDPETDEEKAAWVVEALERIISESTCMLDHWGMFTDPSEEDEERAAALYSVLKHIENLGVGLSVTLQNLMHHFVPEAMLIELVREKIELQNGVPLHVDRINLPGGMTGYALSREEIVVPDTIEELED